ncbi:sodium-dependent phosphate transporter 1-A-like [Paramacrobiotus metropolitanus]|uniref:sodium-dependent phosphate transporter 1-A-like n=1 Tax=Paramacrobiotus metropolitanus TaxID=2943436 RepID=UPI00244634F7|nr:sodium-dependent phosphate transporter 1-A-like [Paramacrobiotus metropolitanus]
MTTPNPALINPSPSYNWDYSWIVGSAFVVAFFTAFTMGANDVANSFGTAVGSRALTLRTACILAIVFETSGAILLGTYMTSWKDTVDLSVYRGNERVLLFGEISSLVGTAMVLLVATLLRIPVSGTHAMVGATVGFSLVKVGPNGVYWLRLLRIVASWFISPLLAGTFSGALYVLIQRFIISTDHPKERGLAAMPFLYGITIFINFSSLFLDGKLMPGVIEKIPWWGSLIISTGLGLITAFVVYFFFVPWQRKKIEDHLIEIRTREFVSLRQRSLSMGDIEEALCSEVATMDEPSTTSDTTTDFGGCPDAAVNRWSRQSHNRRSSLKRHRHRTRQLSKKSLRSISDFEREEFLAEMGMLHAGDKMPSLLEASPSQPGQDSETNSARSDGITMTVVSAVTVTSPTPTGMLTSVAADESIEVLSDNISEGAAKNDTDARDANESEALSEFAMKPSQTESTITTLTEAQLRSNNRKIRPLLNCCSDARACIKERPVSRRSSFFHDDQPETAPIFSYLQIVTATFIAFAHGGNDVCNTVGPLVEIWAIFTYDRIGDENQPNIWLLCFGGLSISAGLCCLGRRVIETIGTTLSPVLPSSGFCVGLGTASTVMLASKVGIPISTTHCIVGSVIIVGLLQCRKEVNLRLFGWIAGGWLITLPLSAAFGAAMMALLLYSA